MAARKERPAKGPQQQQPIPPLLAINTDPVTPWDRFAASALNGLVASKFAERFEGKSNVQTATVAADLADAMMDERRKRRKI